MALGSGTGESDGCLGHRWPRGEVYGGDFGGTKRSDVRHRASGVDRQRFRIQADLHRCRHFTRGEVDLADLMTRAAGCALEGDDGVAAARRKSDGQRSFPDRNGVAGCARGQVHGGHGVRRLVVVAVVRDIGHIGTGVDGDTRGAAPYVRNGARERRPDIDRQRCQLAVRHVGRWPGRRRGTRLSYKYGDAPDQCPRQGGGRHTPGPPPDCFAHSRTPQLRDGPHHLSALVPAPGMKPNIADQDFP